MKIKNFLMIGMVGVLLLVGCMAPAQKENATSQNEQAAASEEASSLEASSDVETSLGAETSTQQAQDDPKIEEPKEESKEEPKKEETVDQKAAKQFQTLAGFIGKSAHDINLVLGQPTTSKTIEETKLLAANYYKIDFCGEIVKVEVDFDVDSQKANYVSFVLIKANDIEATKTAFIKALTGLYGESTIERYMDVQGKQKRDWNDGTLTYDLQYHNNNISLDIYPLDK